MPGVSRKTICACGSVRTPCTARRVICGFSETIASLPPTSALSRVDLPAFGRPIIETNPERCGGGATDESGIGAGLLSLRHADLLDTQFIACQNVNANALTLHRLAGARNMA